MADPTDTLLLPVRSNPNTFGWQPLHLGIVEIGRDGFRNATFQGEATKRLSTTEHICSTHSAIG